MSYLLHLIQWVLAGSSLFLCSYLVILTILAPRGRRLSAPPASRRHRFVVVIPAHNEEASIARTIDSVLSVDYPRSSFRCIVIADNCTDATVGIAASHGATVMERFDPSLRGKGFALRWGFDKLLQEVPGDDALVIVDADSVVSSNMLSVFDSYVERGDLAMQCADIVEPQQGAWSVAMTQIGFLLYNVVRPLGRKAIGGTAGLRGNGMCLTSALLRRIPWAAYSLGEDIEYGIQLLLSGVRVVFAHEATVLATMPRDPRNAESQRSRWEVGRLPVVRRYAWPLLRDALVRPSLPSLDAFLDLITPALVNLQVFSVLMLCLTFVSMLAGVKGMELFVALWLVSVLFGLFHLFAGLAIAGADASLYKALLHVPRYALWKARLYLRIPRQLKKNEWVRTTREGGPQ